MPEILSRKHICTVGIEDVKYLRKAEILAAFVGLVEL